MVFLNLILYYYKLVWIKIYCFKHILSRDSLSHKSVLCTSVSQSLVCRPGLVCGDFYQYEERLLPKVLFLKLLGESDSKGREKYWVRNNKNNHTDYLKFIQFLSLAYTSLVLHNICISLFEYNLLMWICVLFLC